MTFASLHLPSDDFQTELFQFLLDTEGLGYDEDGNLLTTGPVTSYYDSKDILTFGVGLNLSMQNMFYACHER